MSRERDQRRTYRELCSIALALDAVGDRWSLLILRELFAGPKRFTDLASGLPGIGSAVLTERLRELEHHGIVARRRLGPPAPAVLYQLTARGLSVEPVLVGLARWGAGYVTGDEDLTTRGRWLLQAMSATAEISAAAVETVVNFVLDGEESHVRVARGRRLVARDGLDPDARITVRGTVRDLCLLVTAPDQPVAPAASFEVEGDPVAAGRFLDHLVLGFRETARSGKGAC